MKLFNKFLHNKSGNNISLFILSDDAINFISKYAISELSITQPIDEDTLLDILELACDYELLMVDANGNDNKQEYPGKEKYEHGDRFVSEISGKWSKSYPNLIDLNNRLLG
ncbi:MAG: hypothetical protein R3Y23_02745 [Bacillota bacterium]